MRQLVITNLNPDICCLSETHLDQNDNDLGLIDYVAINHSRGVKKRLAKITHGGVSMLVKKDLYQDHRIEVVDKETDGL